MIYITDLRDLALVNAGQKNNPYLLWDNIIADASVSGTAVLTGGARENIQTVSTYDKWRPDVTGTSAILDFDCGSSKTANSMALAAHNLSSFSAIVTLYSSTDGSSWTSLQSATPSDNSALGFRFPAVSARYWRLAVTGLTAGDLISIGVLILGEELIFPRRFYQDFAPVLTATEVELQSNVSVGAQLLGATVVSRGSTIPFAINNVEPGFFRSAEWLNFQTQFSFGRGFFFGWRPGKYPQDFYYCWRSGSVPRPRNSGPRDLMSVEIDARVYNG